MAEDAAAKTNTGSSAGPAGATEKPPEPGKLVPTGGQVFLGIFLALIGGLLIYLLVVLWPAVQAGTSSLGEMAVQKDATISPFGISYTPHDDVPLLLLVIVVSALGSFIHATTSFVDFVGNRRLEVSWVWWYLLRVFVGTSLAVLFYFAVRGGFFAADTTTDAINPYGIAALAGLVGLFSKQATDKLRQLFDTLFNVPKGYGDDARGGNLSDKVPTKDGAGNEAAESATGSGGATGAGEEAPPSGGGQ